VPLLLPNGIMGLIDMALRKKKAGGHPH
jgi:urea transport system permease protein